ncbi:MAG: hypothetical protein K2J99_17985 [Lachnospiraceae bacterium]|nr:hypothetical protein [Lachnospiraceae bacterium]
MSKDQMKKKIKKLLMKIFFVPPIWTLLISVPSFALVIYALAGENVNPVIAYVSYFLSAYALIITMTGIMGVVRFVRHGIDKHPLVRKVLDIPLVGRYLREDMFRAEASLYQGFFINILYAGIKMFSGILYKSVWFVSLSVYYSLLAVMRASLLHFVRKHGSSGEDKAAGLRRYRLCGIILLFMNQALIGIIVLVVSRNSGFEYPGMLIYAMAAYTFYAMTIAVINVVKFRKYGSPVMSAAKVINLTAALVSMLSLETAMITQFGDDEDILFRQIMTVCTGAGITIIVLGMAVYMIVRSTKQLKQISA